MKMIDILIAAMLLVFGLMAWSSYDNAYNYQPQIDRITENIYKHTNKNTTNEEIIGMIKEQCSDRFTDTFYATYESSCKRILMNKFIINLRD